MAFLREKWYAYHAFAQKELGGSIMSDSPLPNGRARGSVWIPIPAFFLSAGAFLAALAFFGMSPFGDLTLITADMRGQYAQFHAYLRHVVSGDQNLLYSTAGGLGANMLPLFAYYLASPLALLTLLFPVSALPEALLLITVLKVGLIGAAYALFARRVLGAGRSSLFFAPCYALCGFAMCYASNIMWLDTLILLPLAIRGAYTLVTRRRWGGLFWALLLMFFTQFYLAYMAGIFTFLCFLGMVWVHKPAKPLRIAIGFAAVTAAAALCAAPILLPTAPTLFANLGARTHTIARSWAPSFPFFSVFSRAFFGAYDTIQTGTGSAAGLPPLYAGTAVLLLFPVYFFNGKIPWRERALSGALCALLLLSFWLPPLTHFWHAFKDATWFQFRYAFLLSFLWVWMAHRCFKQLDGVRLWIVALSGALAMVYALALYPNTFQHTPAFARAATPWLIGLWTALLLWMRLAPKMRGAVLLLCVALATAEVGANAFATLQSIDWENQYAHQGAFAPHYEQRAALLAQLPQEPQEPYRVESDTSYSNNDALALNYSGMRFYSTTANRQFGNALNRLGLQGVGLIYEHTGSTIALDSLLGIRYLLEPEAPNDFYLPVAEQAGLYAFENDFAFPLAFAAPASVLAYRLPEQPFEETPYGLVIRQEDPFALQNSLFAALGAEVFHPLAIEETEYIALTATPLPDGGELLQTEFPAGEDGEDTAPATSGDIPAKRILALTEWDGPVYLYFGNYHEGGSGSLHLGGDPFPVFTLSQYRSSYAVCLGDYGPDEEIELALQLDGESVALACQAIAQLDIGALDGLYGDAWDAQMADIRWRGGHISGTVDAQGERNTLLITVPYDGGWRAVVNGADTPVQRGLDLFCAVPLSPGRNHVTLTYSPPGFAAGLWLAGLGAGSLLLFLALQRAARRRKTK